MQTNARTNSWISIPNGAMSGFFFLLLSIDLSMKAQMLSKPTYGLLLHVLHSTACALCSQYNALCCVATGKFLSFAKNSSCICVLARFSRNMHIRSWQVLSFTLIFVRYLLHHSNQMTAFFYLWLSFELYFQPSNSIDKYRKSPTTFYIGIQSKCECMK